MTSDITIKPLLTVRNLSKDYELHSSPGARFVWQLFGPLSPIKPKIFPAVRGVSFDLYPSEAIAVLGRNGAGKSTLLQMITGLIKPTAGEIALPPRVIGLLELGSGFNPEFTGRENIWINGAILGLRREEIKSKLDDIIAFADIGDYIDEPVRTYSSGMFLRLAFGIATAAAPDLLLVDEVLAVGDIFFRQKCYERLAAMREKGMTIVLVTHALSDAAEFCDRGIVLSEGHMVFSGHSVDATEYYMHCERDARAGTRRAQPLKAPAPVSVETSAGESPVGATDWTLDPACVDLSVVEQVGDPQAASVDRLLITNRNGKPARVFRQGEWACIHVLVAINAPVERAILGIGIRNDRNILVHGKNGINAQNQAPKGLAPGTRLTMTYEVKLDIDYGEYSLDIGIADLDDATYVRRDRLLPEEIASRVIHLRTARGAAAISVILVRREGQATFSHYGIADLPTHFEVLTRAPSELRQSVA